MTRSAPAGRSVLVTGAAHGIGRATALAFAEAGWRVGAYDVDVAGLAGLPVDVVGRLDVTDAQQWREALEGFAPHGLDVLVNNAGVLVSGPLADVDVAAQARVVDVNVKGVLLGCHAAFRHLRPGSCVVNLASASALYGQPGLATYSATKAAVCALTEALDLEWEPHGVRVVDVLPLFVQTDMVRQAGDLRSVRSLGVHLSTEDVAAAVVAAALEPRSRTRGPHRAVGRQARVLSLSGRVSPPALTRQLVARLAR